jgi:hypothetical protein
MWSGSHVLFSEDLESKTTLEFGHDSWGHPSCVSVVLTSLTVASFMWRVACYCERLCLSWLCSCSAFPKFYFFKHTWPSTKECLFGRHICPFICPYETSYREQNGASNFHEIQCITFFYKLLWNNRQSRENLLNERHTLLKEFLNNEDGICIKCIHLIPWRKMSVLTNG